MILTNEQRLEFLKSFNNLRSMLQTIYECQDLWMSDIRKLEDLQCTMHIAMKFVPQEDDEGSPMHYADWVLANAEEEE